MEYLMRYRFWRVVGTVAVAPVSYGFVAWLNWWLPQVQR